MKKIYLVLALFIGLAVSSCGGSGTSSSSDSSESSEVVSEDNASDGANEVSASTSHLATLSVDQIILPAQLKDAVEIIPEDDGNLYVDFDKNNYPEISITFKLLKQVNTGSLVGSTKQMWIVGSAQDAKGRDIKELNPDMQAGEWRTGDSSGDEFKTFLEGDVDNTITMTFTGENNIELFEKDQSKIDEGIKITTDACKNVAKFKLSIKN